MQLKQALRKTYKKHKYTQNLYRTTRDQNLLKVHQSTLKIVTRKFYTSKFHLTVHAKHSQIKDPKQMTKEHKYIHIQANSALVRARKR